MRARGGRLLSLLSYYRSPEENLREVYVRVKNLSPEAVAAIQAELAARFEILYVTRER
jgi:hypothetical protein